MKTGRTTFRNWYASSEKPVCDLAEAQKRKGRRNNYSQIQLAGSQGPNKWDGRRKEIKQALLQAKCHSPPSTHPFTYSSIHPLTHIPTPHPHPLPPRTHTTKQMCTYLFGALNHLLEVDGGEARHAHLQARRKKEEKRRKKEEERRKEVREKEKDVRDNTTCPGRKKKGRRATTPTSTVAKRTSDSTAA